jgi:hypothetical protein
MIYLDNRCPLEVEDPESKIFDVTHPEETNISAKKETALDFNAEARIALRQVHKDKDFLEGYRKIYPKRFLKKKEFSIGEVVDYDCERMKKWIGPATIVGLDGSSYVLRTPEYISRQYCNLRKHAICADYDIPEGMLRADAVLDPNETRKSYFSEKLNEEVYSKAFAAASDEVSTDCPSDKDTDGDLSDTESETEEELEAKALKEEDMSEDSKQLMHAMLTSIKDTTNKNRMRRHNKRMEVALKAAQEFFSKKTQQMIQLQLQTHQVLKLQLQLHQVLSTQLLRHQVLEIQK